MHDTDKVERGLMLLFSVLFFFLLPLPPGIVSADALESGGAFPA